MYKELQNTEGRNMQGDISGNEDAQRKKMEREEIRKDE